MSGSPAGRAQSPSTSPATIFTGSTMLPAPMSRRDTVASGQPEARGLGRGERDVARGRPLGDRRRERAQLLRSEDVVGGDGQEPVPLGHEGLRHLLVELDSAIRRVAEEGNPRVAARAGARPPPPGSGSGPAPSSTGAPTGAA